MEISTSKDIDMHGEVPPEPDGGPRKLPSRVEATAKDRPNPFALFWELGYRHLLPVVPPSAGIRSAGKRPGLLGPQGWYGASSASFQADPAKLETWNTMGAGVGLRCDTDVVGVDIDTMSGRWAETIRATALRQFGPARRRIGNSPKELLVYAMPESMPYRQIRFDDGIDPKKPGLVEILSGDTKWFVVAGVHPGTGKSYRWPDGIPARADLTPITSAQVDAFFTELEEILPRWRGAGATSSVDRTTVDQTTLRGDPDKIRRAMEALPNNLELFGYHEWVRIAIALRASLPGNEALALELFEDWSEKAGIVEERESPTRVFWSVQPPFAIGSDFIFDQAIRHSGGVFTAADVHFDHEAARQASERTPPATSAGLRTPRFVIEDFDAIVASSFEAAAPPLIKGLLDQGAMSVLYGESNSGKTFVALDMSFHIASDQPWAGMKTTPMIVVYIVAEGGRGLSKRLAALRARHPDRQANRLKAIVSNINLLRPDADLKDLIADLQALGEPIGMIVVDTLSRAMAGGDENSSVDMGAMVKHLDAIRAATKAHLMVVHHSGKNKAKGARGHSLLRAATDTEIEVDGGRIAVTKQRDIERNFRSAFVLDPIILGVDSDGDPWSSATVRLIPDAEVQSSDAPAPTAEEREKRMKVAHAVHRVMRDRPQIQISNDLPAIAQELEKAGISKGKSPPSIRKALSDALGGDGVEIESNGQLVRIQVRQGGSGNKSPLIVVAMKVPGEMKIDAELADMDNLSGENFPEESDESLSVFQ